MASTGQENSFPLSFSQQNIYDLESALKGTSANNICTTIRIKGRMDFAVLQKSINEVLKHDSTLRTRIFMEGSKTLQRHAVYIGEDFPVYDFTDSDPKSIEVWEEAMAREAIPVMEGPLYRFLLFREGEGAGGVLVKVHHILSDGWSQVLLCNRIGQTYVELISGGSPSLEESPDYARYVEEEQKYLVSGAYDKDRKYWEGILDGGGEPSALREVRGACVSPVGRRLGFVLPQVLNHAVNSFCQENQVSPFAVFYMALAVYLKRTGGADRFTIGVPVVNRTDYRFKRSTGMFVTTLPFCSEIDDGWNIREFNGKLMEAWYELLRHQRFPFSHIEKIAGEKRGQEGNLFHIALSYQEGRVFESRDTAVSLSGSWHYSGYQAEQMCIHLTNLQDNTCCRVDYDYLLQFFTDREVERLHNSLCGILTEALEHQDKPLYELPVLTAEEKEKVIYHFNKTDHFLPEISVYEALEAEAGKHPDRAAMIHNGEKRSYGELLERSGHVAGQIGTSKGLAAVCLSRGFELLEAMVGILRAGKAFLLLPPQLPAGRIRKILKQSGAGLLLTSHDMEIAAGGPVPCLFMEELRPGEPGRGSAGPEDLAYVVYTSGSTGEPKGVEITQKSLLNLGEAMKDIYGGGPVLSVCGVGFDAFLLESIVALLNGRTIVLPQEEELESPRRLADLISRYEVGFISLTPSRLSAFVRDSAFCNAMGRIETVICGGEAFPPQLLVQLLSVSRARVFNQYGPSETTVAVTMKEVSGASRITAGRPMMNCRLYVLDQRRNPLPAGVYGELYIGGICVGRGYRNQPEQTADHFIPSPFESGEMLYATGDTACWTETGEIVLGGRLDSQVKLRGLRVEPQETASCIASHPLVDAAAARIWELGGQKLLAAYYCSEEVISETELLTFAADYLPYYMIPSFLIRLDRLPMTANGKLQEEKLPKPCGYGEESEAVQTGEQGGDSVQTASKGGGWHISGKDVIDEGVLALFRETLGRQNLAPQDDYFLSGGNSLNAMETIARIEGLTGITIRVADLYACRTASRLAACLREKGVQAWAEPAALAENHGDAGFPAENASGDRTVWLQKTVKQHRYRLSPMQQGIYVQNYLDPDGLAYHMPGAFELSGDTDWDRLEEAFRRIIREEDVLRTCFVREEDGIQACIQDEVSFSLDRLGGDRFEDACQQFLLPFDLGRAPLLRAALWRSKDGTCFLFLDSHHIIGDGMSTPILLKRLDSAYCGREQAVLFSYQDYVYTMACREKEEKMGEARSRSADYWKQRLGDLPKALELPTDSARPHRFDFRGGEYRWKLSVEDSRRCREYCHSRGISSYAIFLAAFSILLSKISGKEDFLVGAPVAGRIHPGTMDICGPFINTLPLRLKPQGGKSVSSYLEEVKTEVNGMLDHQQTSLEEILTLLDLPRGEQNRLYQVMFSQSPVDTEAFVLDGRKMVYWPIPTGTVKMDLTAELYWEGNCYRILITYASSLFLEETIAFYGRCLEQILNSMLRDGEQHLEEINVLSIQDRERYVEQPNRRVTPFENIPIHRMIEEMNDAAPDAPAVIYKGRTVTRKELEHRACGLAHLMAEAGAKPGQCVGLGFSRTPDLFAAMLAILKLGCAYVPLLPSFPEARLSYMLEIACVSYVLCDQKTAGRLPEGLPCRRVIAVERQEAVFESVPVGDEDLVNVMFTSGSTGKPKGVMLKQRSVSSLYVSIRELLQRAEGPILCTTNVVFDSFIGESLFPLAMGKKIVLMDEEDMMLPWKLAEAIRQYGVQIFQVTPARLQMCLGNDAFCRAAALLKLVLLGGEVLTPQLLSGVRGITDAAIVNMYGPTEATVYMTMTEVSPGEHITIGRPLYNSRIYVLDDKMEPVLPTACGELYMAGECLAKGYISRPDLTESAFLPDPFFPGERMYKSGDMGRLRLDGSFDFLGRLDAQVKLNGQRVEMDEITGAILESDCAQQAASLALRREDGSMEICSFLVPVSAEAGLEARLRGYLKKVLPAYMIPSRLVLLSKMPLTASSKIDLKALEKLAGPEGGHKPGDGSDTERENNFAGRGTEAAHLLEIWSKVLERPRLDPKVSFFEQGGTSLAALNVLSCYFNEHIEMTLSQFYENPTAVQQAAVIGAAGGKNGPDVTSPDKVFPEPACVVKDNGPNARLGEVPHSSHIMTHWGKTVPKLKVTEGYSGASGRSEGRVLLTGAAGFLGAHLLRALLGRKEIRQVICIQRDGSRERLFDCLSWYFGRGWILSHQRRIIMMKGDITLEMLGIAETDYLSLAGHIDGIYHAAADVRHYAADTEAYLRTNVEGTGQMLKLAKAAGVPFYHMSTCSVSGEQLKGGGHTAVFTENDYDIGQRWEENIYVKSKFLAEGLVMEAAGQGMETRIFRLGRLVGRASDGVFQRNPGTNIFYLLMKGFCLAGAMPESVAGAEVDLTPVDYCAEAILALREREGPVFHIIHPCPPTAGEAAAAMDSGIKVVPDELFQRLLEKAVQGAQSEALSPLLDYWRRIRIQPPAIKVSCTKTQEQLSLSGFDFPIPSPEYLLAGFELQDS